MLEVTDQNFKSEVLDADRLVVVDFYASWCGPCQFLSPKMEEFAQKYNYNNVKIVKMSVENNQATPSKYNVMSIPTIIFFNKGKVVDQVIGADPDNIEKKIKEL